MTDREGLALQVVFFLFDRHAEYPTRRAWAMSCRSRFHTAHSAEADLETDSLIDAAMALGM